MASRTKPRPGPSSSKDTPSRLDPIARSKASPQSRSLAIRAKCFDCVGGGADPNWQRMVAECPVDCPLKPFRPYRNTAQEDE